MAKTARRAGAAPRTKARLAKPAAKRTKSRTARRARSAGPAVSPSAEASKGKLERARLPGPPSKTRTDGAAGEETSGKYVYCVIKSERPLSFGMLGIGADAAEVHTVHYRDIAAIVSNTPMVVQDP